MHKRNFNILLILVLFVLGACKKDEIEASEDLTPKPQSTSINKIMPLGASRVEGSRPDYESFRYELWKDLVENNHTFDFIGTMTDNGSYPNVGGNSFDPDHEGRGGWTSGQILSSLDSWLDQTGAPDIVLFSSPGGNDALEGLDYNQMISNVNSIIDKLQARNANVTIIIENMAPGHSSIMGGALGTYLSNLQQDLPGLASNQSTSSSQVIVVDMNTGFTDAMLADDVHYNQQGAVFIADRYYSVLSGVLAQ